MMISEFFNQKYVTLMMIVHVFFAFLGLEEGQQPSVNKQEPSASVAAAPNAAHSTSAASAIVQEEMKAYKQAAAHSQQAVRMQASNYKYVPKLNSDVTKYKAVEVVATGYSPGKESTGKTPEHPEYGITFSGIKVKRDDKALSTIAADPDVFPLGTVLFIPGYGYGVVADIGSAIKGKKIDLYFDTKDQVYKEWGKKTVKVFIVKEGTGKVTELIWNQLRDEILSPTPAI